MAFHLLCSCLSSTCSHAYPATSQMISGCGIDLFINICLTLLGYIPGHLHAFCMTLLLSLCLEYLGGEDPGPQICGALSSKRGCSHSILRHLASCQSHLADFDPAQTLSSSTLIGAIRAAWDRSIRVRHPVCIATTSNGAEPRTARSDSGECAAVFGLRSTIPGWRKTCSRSG